MVHQFFTFIGTQERMHEGPLGCYVDDFAVLLHEQGYSRQFAACQIRWVADFSRWLYKQGLSAADLSQQSVSCYLRYRKSRMRNRGGVQSTLDRLLNLLREKGISRQKSFNIVKNARQEEEERYKNYLLSERGLSPRKHFLITLALFDSFSRNVLGKEPSDSPTCVLKISPSMYNVMPTLSVQVGINFLQRLYVPS